MSSAKSKPPSGTTSRRRKKRSAEPAFQFPTIYIDESASQTILAAALKKRRLKVRTRHEVFSDMPDVDDVTWLAHCGRYGWIAITKDRAIRHRLNEITMVKNAKVRMFVIAAGDITADEQAELVIGALPQMRRIVKERTSPFIVRLSAGSRTELTYPSGRSSE